MRAFLSSCAPLLSLLLLMPGCAKPEFIYDVDSNFFTASYRTMAPDPRTDRILIREGMRPLNPNLHLKAVLTELETRNFRLAPPTDADLWVTVYVLMGAPGGRGGASTKAEHREGSGEGHHGRGGRGGMGGGGSPAGKEGGAFSVIVQLQDRKTGRPVWQGEAQVDHREQGSDGRPLSPEEAVHRLLQPLPKQP